MPVSILDHVPRCVGREGHHGPPNPLSRGRQLLMYVLWKSHWFGQNLVYLEAEIHCRLQSYLLLSVHPRKVKLLRSIQSTKPLWISRNQTTTSKVITPFIGINDPRYTYFRPFPHKYPFVAFLSFGPPCRIPDFLGFVLSPLIEETSIDLSAFWGLWSITHGKSHQPFVALSLLRGAPLVELVWLEKKTGPGNLGGKKSRHF